MAANKGMVAGSHNHNEFVMICHDGDAPACVFFSRHKRASAPACVGGSGLGRASRSNARAAPTCISHVCYSIMTVPSG
jgi:hypothetical protein